MHVAPKDIKRVSDGLINGLINQEEVTIVVKSTCNDYLATLQHAHAYVYLLHVDDCSLHAATRSLHFGQV